jgi:hypothetical protein
MIGPCCCAMMGMGPGRCGKAGEGGGCGRQRRGGGQVLTKVVDFSFCTCFVLDPLKILHGACGAFCSNRMCASLSLSPPPSACVGGCVYTQTWADRLTRVPPAVGSLQFFHLFRHILTLCAHAHTRSQNQRGTKGPLCNK